MKTSRGFEDKDEYIPYVVIMQPIRKLEEIKWQYRLSENMDESQS